MNCSSNSEFVPKSTNYKPWVYETTGYCLNEYLQVSAGRACARCAKLFQHKAHCNISLAIANPSERADVWCLQTVVLQQAALP